LTERLIKMGRHDEHDRDILARTLFGEARANDVDDAQAIASVILNRVNYKNWPNKVADVCLQPWQFSCWNQNDPNRDRILQASGAWWEDCKAIAAMALNGLMSDSTKTSTHYYARYIKTPGWARGRSPAFETEVHIFFNDIDTPPPTSAAEALEDVRPIAKTRTAQGAAIAAGATVAAPVIEQMGQIAQAGTLMTTIGSFAPWVLGVIALVGIAYILWARLDDRKKGYR